jgi:DNA-binding CsgD family transcriptional regulator
MRPYFDESRVLALLTGSRMAGRHVMLTFGYVGALIILLLFQSGSEEPRRLAEAAIDRAIAGGHAGFLHNARFLAGLVAITQGRLTDATHLLQTSLAEGRQVDETLVWKCGFCLSWVAMLRGDLAGARSAMNECLSVVRVSEAAGGSGRMVEPVSKLILGWIELGDGDPAKARQMLASVADYIRESPLSRLASLPLVALAETQPELGAHEDCEANLDAATSLAQAGELTWVLGRADLVRARLQARRGDLQEAESGAHEAIKLGREAGDRLGMVDAVDLLARLAAEQGSGKEAIRLWSAGHSLREQLGYHFAIDRVAQDAALARAQESVRNDEFESAWSEGAKLSLEQAISYATRGRGERRRPTTGWSSLTPSELEVARLVGQHLSNPEIATRLFISRATVKTHLVHIFAKLCIDSRSELAAQAIQRRA